MRADAVRNHASVLTAAGRLFDQAEHPDEVTMEVIAAAAGVGKGTLFRRFGDRVGLITALFEERLRELRSGLEPSGGTPADQVLDVLTAIVDFKTGNRVLSLALENAGRGSPYAGGGYAHWHALLTRLVTEARGPRDADYLAHALLAAVRSDLIEHLHGWPPARLRQGLSTLVSALLSAEPPAAGRPAAEG
jgi:AcrR family transcriptional regulator